ncbi:MAG TPA: hypothetical protein VGK64_04795 [Bryobacteraceae bacterium]
MSNRFANQTKEGLPLFSSGRDAIACQEMMEILRWENEGGRIWMSPQLSRSQHDIRERDAGTDVAKQSLLTYMTNENNSQGGSYQ